MLTDEDYDKFLKDYWGTDDIIVIEQDIVPTVNNIVSLAECKEDWCVCRYIKDLPTIKLFAPNYEHKHYLGCTKFSKSLQERFPPSVWKVMKEKSSWKNLDVRIRDTLLAAGLDSHVHGEVKHNHIFTLAEWGLDV
jgi:hypothetical protein